MLIKGFKFRIYPTREQEIFFSKSFGCYRFVYNWGLAKKTSAYASNKKSISYFDLCNELPNLKTEHSWLSEVYSQSLQSSLRNLDNAYTKFFKKTGEFPKAKKKLTSSSFQMPQGCSIESNKLYIPKVKIGIKIKLHREIPGKIKTTTISKNSYGQYFVSFLVETTHSKKRNSTF